MPFDELQEHLDMDLGFGPHAEILEVQPNFGEGEIENARGRKGSNAVVVDLTGEDDDMEVQNGCKGKQPVGVKREVGFSGYATSARGRQGRR